MGLAVGYPDEEWAIAGHARDPAFFLAHTHGHSPFLLLKINHVRAIVYEIWNEKDSSPT